MPAEVPLALGPAAGHLHEALGLISPDPSPLKHKAVKHKAGVPFNFYLMNFYQKCTVWAAWTSKTTLWPPLALGVGVRE